MSTHRPARILHMLSIDRPGDPPEAVCMSCVDEDVENLEEINCRDEASVRTWKPDDDRLHVLYGGERTLACFVSLGWPLPRKLIDLHAEVRNMTNQSGVKLDTLNETLRALNIPDATEQTARFNAESGDIMDLMDDPVRCSLLLILLYRCVKKFLDDDPQRMRNALFRGQYIKSVALMRHRGIPVDVPLLNAVQQGREQIIRTLIDRCEQRSGYGLDINRGPDRDWIEFFDREQRRVDETWPGWPVGAGGQLLRNEQAFSHMARLFPRLNNLCRLHTSLGKISKVDLPVGSDNRHRHAIAPFSTVTGRNQPGTRECLFQQSKWMRKVLCPPPGGTLACIDWNRQEFGICAALSRDPRMIDAYTSGDPYLEFAKRAGAVPPGATARTHSSERDLYKEVTLAIQYGMGQDALARRTGIPALKARELLETHRILYPDYWNWRERIVNEANLEGRLTSILGWQRIITRGEGRNSIANFPVQACGAAMMQMASVLAMEEGIGVCCPVHDAFLIESPSEQITETVERMTGCMNEASSLLLDGLQLSVQVCIITPEHRYGIPDEALWCEIAEAIGWSRTRMQEGDAQ